MSLGSCSFVPPFLLERIAASSHEAADHCRLTLARDQELREGRAAATTAQVATAAPAVGGPAWVVHTARNGSTLPGDVVRSAGDPESGDTAADQASDGITASLSMYSDVFERSSYDGHGAPVVLTVHYEQDYDNASGTAPSWCSVTATARSSAASPGRSTCWGTSSPTRSPSSPRR